MTDVSEKIDHFFHQFDAQTLSPNSILFTGATQNNFFYYIEKGAVKMLRVSNEGRNLNLHIFFSRSFFPLLDLLDNSQSNHEFTTLVPTVIRKAPKTEFLSFIADKPDILIDIQSRLLKGLSGLLVRIEQTAFSPAYNRVASLLIYFSNHFSEPSNSSIRRQLTLKITHQEIADWLGLSRENVSIQMKLLERQGLIKITNHFLEIPNINSLQKVAGTLNLI